MSDIFIKNDKSRIYSLPTYLHKHQLYFKNNTVSQLICSQQKIGLTLRDNSLIMKPSPGIVIQFKNGRVRGSPTILKTSQFAKTGLNFCPVLFNSTRVISLSLNIDGCSSTHFHVN